MRRQGPIPSPPLLSIAALLAAAIAPSCAPASEPVKATLLAPAAPQAGEPAGPLALWREDFSSGSLPWKGLFGEPQDVVSQIYKVEKGEDGSFLLHATSDARPGRPKDLAKAVHVGVSFADEGLSLARARVLHFKWRVLKHPDVGDDPWEDLAASVYVIVRRPTVLGGGRGFKLGWLAKPGKEGARQMGLLQVALRAEPATKEWREEAVDLCALYEKDHGPCDGESILALGPLTDADNTRSLAEADYGAFELRTR